MAQEKETFISNFKDVNGLIEELNEMLSPDAKEEASEVLLMIRKGIKEGQLQASELFNFCQETRELTQELIDDSIVKQSECSN
jgi:protein subunit release factor A